MTLNALPPARFIADYAPLPSPAPKYSRIDTHILDHAAIEKLLAIYRPISGLNLYAALIAALCATIVRTTVQHEGVVGAKQNDGTLNAIYFLIDSTTLPADLISSILAQIDKHCTLQVNESTPTDALPFAILFSAGSDFAEPNLSSPGVQTLWQLRCTSEGVHLRIHYTDDLFLEDSIKMFSHVFSSILRAFTFHSAVTIQNLPLCDDLDLAGYTALNDTSKPIPNFTSVSDCIRHRAEAASEAYAIVHDDRSISMTYNQLNLWSDSLAQWLLSQGYGGAEETVIGVWQTRSALLVVSYLACLKAGCAYMPIEMSLPAERVTAMLEDSSSPLVLGFNPSELFRCTSIAKFVDLNDFDMQNILHTPTTNIAGFPAVTSDRLASIIFTSGSTGAPKAIMIQHSSLLNFIFSDFKPIQKGDRTAMMLNIAFDVSSGEIWYPLARQATLVCYLQPVNTPFDVSRLSDFIVNENINSIHAPVAIIKALVDADFFTRSLPELRLVAMGGEALHLDLIQRIRSKKPALMLSNNYGPSESTIDATTFTIYPTYTRRNVSIGRPMANIGAYVVDEQLKPVPRGVCGELLLTGSGLSRGYLRRPELTAQNFISFGIDHPIGFNRAYRTGDIVRLSAEDDLEFIRRMDDGQVKVRGHRIELGEVEDAIRRHGEVKDAVVVLLQRGASDAILVGYYIPTGGGPISTVSRSLFDFLCTLLPSYMIPSSNFVVEAFPLTRTSKVDRQLMATAEYMALCMASVPVIDTQEFSPQESTIRDIFSKGLGVPFEVVGLHDNLFNLGGHSLIATRIVLTIRRHFNVMLSITTFMENATVAGISDLLFSGILTSGQSQSQWASIPREHSGETLLPAADAQTRLWVEEEMNPGLARYNAGFQRKLTGYCDISALKCAFRYLVDRHEALRTTFHMTGDTLMQLIEPATQVDVRVIAVPSSRPNLEDEVYRILSEERSKVFNLALDVPVRFTIIKVTNRLHWVSAIIHHIATDGWSARLIDHEVSVLYNALVQRQLPSLPHLPIRYRDYSIWQQWRAHSGSFASDLEYWGKQLAGATPLELFNDFERPEKLSGNASELPFEINSTRFSCLRKLASSHATSLYVVLLAAFRAAIFRSTGQDDGTIGMANANRPAPELEGIVGFFVNTHAIRLIVDPSVSFDDLILQTKQVTAEALDHAEVPFDKVVAHLSPERSVSRNALAQLIVQDFSGMTGYDSSGFNGLVSEDIRTASTRLDLTIHVYLHGNSLKGYTMYQSDLFFPETIATFTNIFLRIIESASRQPSLALSYLSLTTDNDMRLLNQWNNNRKACPDISIGDAFKQVVVRERSSTAIIDGQVTLTYSELDEASDHLACWLLRKNMSSESVVGIWMGRSALLVISYIACLKAGLAYMPLDKGLPVNRLRVMVQTADCRIVLAAGLCPLQHDVEVINLLDNQQIISETTLTTLPTVEPTALSNVIYTSGSTGIPKGVMIRHCGMINLCSPNTSAWPGKTRNALSVGVGFDPSGFQIFSTLLSGGELHCLPDMGIFDLNVYRVFLVDSKVQRCFMTPSVLSALLLDGSEWLKQTSLEHIMLGGEKLEPSRVAECRRRLPHLEVFSSYGPAEASVRSAYFSVPISYNEGNRRRIPLGRSLPNTSIYVVDDKLKPVPAGVLGEIVVGGIHVARGYLNQPELTMTRFIELKNDEVLGGRIYRTGDVGYWSADGLLHYVGRNDSQVKLRGQRIEPQEIETIMNRHSAIKESAVVIVNTVHGDQLVSYTVLKTDQSSTEEDVLSLWDTHYNDEEAYNILDDDAAGKDFARWYSMYNGERIPMEEMKEWLSDTLDQIIPKKEDRVLEIGAGTGMIALNIIHSVTSYVGTDISRPSLNFLHKQVESLGLSSKISLAKAAAHQLDELPQKNFSLVIINSVAQYFPSSEYLIQVIEKLLTGMVSTGRIFLGDIRSYSLVQYHDVERALGTLDSTSSVEDVRHTITSYSDSQTELLLDPSFFYGLQRRLPSIAHIEIKPKMMKARNELSRYRYSATIHVGERPFLCIPQSWLDCSKDDDLLSGLRAQLHASTEVTLGATNIPMADMGCVKSVIDYLNNTSSTDTVLALRRQLEIHPSAKVSTPVLLKCMALEEGWDLVVDYTMQYETLLRAIFARRPKANPLVGDFPPLLQQSTFHNVIAKSQTDVTPVLKSVEEYLRDRVPEYMVPSVIISVNGLPLNRSGKLDRRILVSKDYFQGLTSIKRTRPETFLLNDTERDVLAIFSRLLHIPADEIDVNESLFSIGGHSLMATSVVSAIRREMSVDLSMAAFFRYPTVRDVSAMISANSKKMTNGLTPSNIISLELVKSTIVTNSDREGPTLFLFPETTGFASVYSVALESITCPVVAFGDEHWANPVEGETIETTAAELVLKIFHHQPEGPYYLAGWSYGGYLALEVAVQLEYLGKSIALVLMFDPSIYQERLETSKWRSELDHLLSVVNSKNAWLSQFSRVNAMISKYAISNKKYKGKVILVKALRGRPGDEQAPREDAYNGWLGFLPQIEICGFDSTHRSMFDRINGPKMGGLISEIVLTAVNAKLHLLS